MVFNIGLRSIQQYGTTFLINLPAVWVENHGLKKKDKLALYLGANGELIITPIFDDGDNVEN